MTLIPLVGMFKPRYYEVVGHMAEQTTAIQHLLTDTNPALSANG